MRSAVLMICSLVLLAVSSPGQSIFHRSLYLDRKIAGLTKISSEWVEIKPDKLLTQTGDGNIVCLYLAESYRRGLRVADGVQLPDGSTVVPEVEIEDVEGTITRLDLFGARGEMMLMYGWPKNWTPTSNPAPADRIIRIRA